jgi:hypothetical protein
MSSVSIASFGFVAEEVLHQERSSPSLLGFAENFLSCFEASNQGSVAAGAAGRLTQTSLYRTWNSESRATTPLICAPLVLSSETGCVRVRACWPMLTIQKPQIRVRGASVSIVTDGSRGHAALVDGILQRTEAFSTEKTKSMAHGRVQFLWPQGRKASSRYCMHSVRGGLARNWGPGYLDLGGRSPSCIYLHRACLMRSSAAARVGPRYLSSWHAREVRVIANLPPVVWSPVCGEGYFCIPSTVGGWVLRLACKTTTTTVTTTLAMTARFRAPCSILRDKQE